MIIVLLAAVITFSVIVAWSRHEPGQPIEISIEPEQAFQGEIYVGGGVNSPGIYPLKAGDTIDDILGAAGGVTANGAPERLELIVNDERGAEIPQKVDINRAGAWLLGALPGIGEGRAQAIIDYRNKNGLFRSIDELLKAPGIGETVFEGIKDLVTIGE